LLVVAVYETPHGRMVLVADEELVGRSFYDQEESLILMVPESLYSGRLASEEEAAKWMDKADIIVATGERAVGIAVRRGYAHPDSVVRIRGVPHVQVYSSPTVDPLIYSDGAERYRPQHNGNNVIPQEATTG